MGDIAARTPLDNAGRMLSTIMQAVQKRLSGGTQQQWADSDTLAHLQDAVTKLAGRLNDDSLIVAQLMVSVTSGMEQTMAELVTHTFEAPEPLDIDDVAGVKADISGLAPSR